jgi:hypothetical protein
MLRKFKTLLVGAAFSITFFGAASADWKSWTGQDEVTDIFAPGWTDGADGYKYDLVQKSLKPKEVKLLEKMMNKKFGVALAPREECDEDAEKCGYALTFTSKEKGKNLKSQHINVQVMRASLQEEVEEVNEEESNADVSAPVASILAKKEKDGKKGDKGDKKGDKAPKDEAESDIFGKIIGIVKDKVLPMLLPAVEKAAPALIEMIIGKLTGGSAEEDSAANDDAPIEVAPVPVVAQ